MIPIGRILEIWRYPVSSLGGEMCDAAIVESNGLHGDRQYALFDPSSGSVASPEKEPRWRPALFLNSALDADGPRIGFPDGSWYRLTDLDLLPMLSSHFGFDVVVGRYRDGDERTALLPRVNNRYDVASIHLITTASLNELERKATGTAIDRRRFRPNVLVEVEHEDGFAETAWLGDTLHIDRAVGKVTEPTKRCGMTFIPQPGLDEQAEILRTIVRHNKRSLGIYCEVMKPGRIELGASVVREES
ncbi:MOSC domain-containing protein [Rhizobiales bacterium RZME27]|uniref:MOSC domain-containing protein n=1 Tax=Endobacterium cereale TaxID=2663029 RepID=A0A6A8A583_9HYPH|nr:MOSC domain-containing protein [Endobacterium cereale]MEB2846779.1 MOSC domain-containing protein [Endobacterium cereale]MQY46502.1 MOSC domain-containing protein [Endobacterium cereale]